MSHSVVKIIVDQSGEPVEKKDQVWHLIEQTHDAETTLCGGEVFNSADVQSEEAESRTKVVNKGGITCSNCLAIIKRIKAIKL